MSINFAESFKPRIDNPGRIIFYAPQMGPVKAHLITKAWAYQFISYKLVECLEKAGYVLVHTQLIHPRNRPGKEKIRIGRYVFYLVRKDMISEEKHKKALDFLREKYWNKGERPE